MGIYNQRNFVAHHVTHHVTHSWFKSVLGFRSVMDILRRNIGVDGFRVGVGGCQPPPRRARQAPVQTQVHRGNVLESKNCGFSGLRVY